MQQDWLTSGPLLHRLAFSKPELQNFWPWLPSSLPPLLPSVHCPACLESVPALCKKIPSEAPSAKRYDHGIHKFRIWTTTWLIAIWCSSLARHTFHASLISFALLYHWGACNTKIETLLSWIALTRECSEEKLPEKACYIHEIKRMATMLLIMTVNIYSREVHRFAMQRTHPPKRSGQTKRYQSPISEVICHHHLGIVPTWIFIWIFMNGLNNQSSTYSTPFKMAINIQMNI